jgi:hypothetical protein
MELPADGNDDDPNVLRTTRTGATHDYKLGNLNGASKKATSELTRFREASSGTGALEPRSKQAALEPSEAIPKASGVDSTTPAGLMVED